MTNKDFTECIRLVRQGRAFLKEGKSEQALRLSREAIAHNAKSSDALCLMGETLLAMGFDGPVAAIPCFKKAISIAPDDVKFHTSLGHCYYLLGEVDLAVSAFEKACSLDPGDLSARVRLLISRIAPVYISTKELHLRRADYAEALECFEKTLDLSTSEKVENASNAVKLLLNFFLPYQIENDVELQKQAGRIITTIQAKRYPQWSRCVREPKNANRKIRVGIVSGFFCSHSIWKIQIKGWLENLNTDRFELFGYSTGKSVDQVTATARTYFAFFFEETKNLESMAKQISKDKPDLLLYPEIGMNRLTLQLASLRLAPVQCISWGHPMTSGLSTMDYMLGSDLIESKQAQNHYSESLVRLPNLSSYYEPIPIEPSELKRRDFDLREEATVYLCVQTIYKYLPQYDFVFAEIAARNPDSQFVFLRRDFSSALFNRFYNRLKKVFDEAGLDEKKHLVVLPQIQTSDYHALNQVADIYLDSIGWSGHTTTFEAVQYNLPIVTMPGDLMRTRLSYGILKMMGVIDTVAWTTEAYVDIACRLADDRFWKDAIRNKIHAKKHRLYRDLSPIRAMESFFEKAVGKI